MRYSIEQYMGAWQSYSENNEPLVYAGSKWECEFWTEQILKETLKDGKVVHNGTVDGKL